VSINQISRRQFGLAVAGTLATGAIAQHDTAEASSEAKRQRHAREIWVASVGQMGLEAKSPLEMCEKMLSRMEEVTPLRPDIVCTPEAFPFVGLPKNWQPSLPDVAEERSGPILDQFAAFALRHNCYVICSTYTKEAGRYYDSAVLFDRKGQYAGEYRKMHPTDGEMRLGLTPGPLRAPVFETDFGTIGIQICYDVNWHEAFRQLGEDGAKIVFWPSAFPGGMMLNSLAWMNKYHLVSSTGLLHPTQIVDPLGETVCVTGRAANWVCTPLNLDSAIVQTVKYFPKFKDIQDKYGRGFRIKIFHDEALALIEGVSAELSVAQALREFDIPTSREMLAVSTKLQNAKRPA
jgi:beta-ureidopropionase